MFLLVLGGVWVLLVVSGRFRVVLSVLCVSGVLQWFWVDLGVFRVFYRCFHWFGVVSGGFEWIRVVFVCV